MGYLHKRASLGVLLLLVLAAAAYLLFAAIILGLDGRTTSASTVPQNKHHFVWMPGGDDYVFNWDYRSRSNVRTNVDWGMRFIYKENATIDKVKDKLDGKDNNPSITPKLDARFGRPMHARIEDDDYQHRDWDSDQGKKNNNHCGWNWGHSRFYSTGPSHYNQDDSLGHYIVATIHADLEKGGNLECEERFRSYESDERKWVDRIEDNLRGSPYNWSISGSFNWKNAMPTTDISGHGIDEEHSYQSNGYGRIVRVP